MAEQAGMRLPGLLNEEGKSLMVAFPATEGFKTWFCSADDSGTEKGGVDGQFLRIDWANDDVDSYPKTQNVTLSFNEPVEVHDGQGFWNYAQDEFSFDDLLSMYVNIPANTVTPSAGGNTGNCNLYPLGGGANMIVPAAGDGAYDIDLETAVVSQTRFSEKDGQWHVNNFTGVITAPGAIEDTTRTCNLYDFPIQAYMIRNIMLGNPIGVLDIDVYKVEWVHQTWSFVMSVRKNTKAVNNCTIGGWILCFRPTPTL